MMEMEMLKGEPEGQGRKNRGAWKKMKMKMFPQVVALRRKVKTLNKKRRQGR